MNNKFYSYLESYEKISIIIPKENYNPNETYKLIGNDEIIDLSVFEHFSIGDEEKLVANFDAYIMLEEPYYVVSSNGDKSYLRMGKIVRTSLFDSIYHYKKNDLGYTYSKETTKFKIWAPTAKSVKLELISPSGKKEIINSTYRKQGIYRTIVNYDVEGYKYRYYINVNGEDIKTVDPYAISASPNGEYGYVVDKNKFYKMKKYHLKNDDNIIIYETSIRDFTSLFKDDKERSTYNAFTKDYKSEKGNLVGLKYLKKLGVTHIQIMPFYLFGGVDENDRYAKYNWGYNPVLYNTPSGAYSINPNDPYSRINELKRMIDKIHSIGLKVVMDVVYNHVYLADDYPFEVMCPGYMYVYNREGIRTNSSGCGNDVNTSKSMIRKFIIESVNYWFNEFSIDGFRFDIMGLIDFETMNDIALGIHETNPNIIIYGEGWKMVDSNRADNLAHMFNKSVVSDIGFFNDKFRNSIKDYSLGLNYDKDIVKNSILGSCINKFLFKYAHQSINYIECHDDETVFDWMKKRSSDISIDELKQRSLLAQSINILSIGIPFLHSGAEFYRSKNGESNSYKSPDSINMINWNQMDDNMDSVNFIKELIAFRKQHDSFKLDTPTLIQSRVNIEFTKEDTIIYTLDNIDKEIRIIFKNHKASEYFDYSGFNLYLSNIPVSSNDTISGIGTMILIKEK